MLVIGNGRLVTRDAANPFIENGAVAMDGNVIKKVGTLEEVKKEFPHMYRTGHPVGQPFGYDFFEFYVPGETEQRYKEVYGVDMPDQQITLRPGDSVFVDLTGDGKVDANDVHAIGYSDIPEYTGSINATLNWKGLDFSMTWVGATHVNRQLSSFYTPTFAYSPNQSATSGFSQPPFS